MDFSITISVTTDKKGAELLEEYDRLNFETRPSEFGVRRLTIGVDWDFVKQHKEAFKESNSITVHLDSLDTSAEDWEDWGSAGNVLSKPSFDDQRLGSIIKDHFRPQQQSDALKLWRTRLGLSQRDAAKRLSYSLKRYQELERGANFETGEPVQLDQRTALAAAAIEHNLDPINADTYNPR